MPFFVSTCFGERVGCPALLLPSWLQAECFSVFWVSFASAFSFFYCTPSHNGLLAYSPLSSLRNQLGLVKFPESPVGTLVLLQGLSSSSLSAEPALDWSCSTSDLLTALPPPRRVILTAHLFRALSYWVPQLFVQRVYSYLTFSVQFSFFTTHAVPRILFLVSLDFSFPLSPS